MRFIALSLLLLAGCATPQQRADRIIKRYGPLCEQLGYQPYTDPWRACVLSREDAAEMEQATRSAGAAANRSRTCTTVGSTTTCN